jgi:hypothetical protein
MIALTESERYWHDMQFELRRRLEEEASSRRHARWVAFRERIEKELFAKRAQRKALEVPTAGPGWRVEEGPCSHAELERFAVGVFDLAFHNIPRPPYRVVWGIVHHDADHPRALACAAADAKVIVVDRRYVGAHDADELIETLCHEWTHALWPGEGHNAKFQATLASARHYLQHLHAPPVRTPRPPGQVLHEAAVLVNGLKGRRRIGPGTWGAPIPGDTWEYRDAR